LGPGRRTRPPLLRWPRCRGRRPGPETRSAYGNPLRLALLLLFLLQRRALL
jgi:hypothetical protein